ncbi:MAG: acetyl-CoA C-acyltransferase [Planctomycetaceae bacterium]
MNKPLAILSGMRTPFCKAYTSMADVHAVDLGVAAVTAALKKANVSTDGVDEVVIGNVSAPADAANIARVVALKAGIPQDRIAHTVNRNCASGMESILTAWQILNEGRANTVVAGGTESMSNIPLLVRTDAAKLLMELGRAKSMGAKLKTLSRLRPKHFKPVPGVMLGLTDPFCGLNMGQTAEKLAREFSISREDQDRFALDSHMKAAAARERCFLSGEVTPFGDIEKDTGPRDNQTIAALQKLKPIFDKAGSVTAGNSCPLTDGAAAVVLAKADAIDIQSVQPLGYITGYAIAGCDPSRMGLGPVYATAKVLKQTGLQLSNFDLFEINEAFAAQVLACLTAFESDGFAKLELGLDKALGTVPRDRLNVHGGAIALGHPVGTTGTRMIITLLRALKGKGLHRGLATLCVGGGQGVAIVVETAV